MKVLQEEKDANPELDKQATSLLQKQELKRLVKHDMVDHYEELKEHKQLSHR